MIVPPHLEPLRRSKLMGQCVCGVVTDLMVGDNEGRTAWCCWRCQELPEMHMHKQCEGCQAWFVGPESRKRCGHGPGCGE